MSRLAFLKGVSARAKQPFGHSGTLDPSTLDPVAAGMHAQKDFWTKHFGHQLARQARDIKNLSSVHILQHLEARLIRHLQHHQSVEAEIKAAGAWEDRADRNSSAIYFSAKELAASGTARRLGWRSCAQGGEHWEETLFVAAFNFAVHEAGGLEELRAQVKQAENRPDHHDTGPNMFEEHLDMPAGAMATPMRRSPYIR